MSTLVAPILIGISAAARQAGTTPSVLRIWEQRYGWPIPRRSRGGARRFTVADVARIAEVVAYLRSSGSSPGEVFVAGRPLLAYERNTHPPRIELDVSRLPQPVTAEGIDNRRLLLLGLGNRHSGQVVAAVAQCARLRPSDRGPSVLLVLDAYRTQVPDHAWLDQALEH